MIFPLYEQKSPLSGITVRGPRFILIFAGMRILISPTTPKLSYLLSRQSLLGSAQAIDRSTQPHTALDKVDIPWPEDNVDQFRG